MKIKAILNINDTRQFAEVDGRMKALSGTGERNACALCGSLHEIHAMVQFDNGSVAVVGVACAKKSAPVVFKLRELDLKLSEQLDKKAALLEENSALCTGGNWWVRAGSGRFETLLKFDRFEQYAVRVAPNRHKIKTCLGKIAALSEQASALRAQ